MTFKQHYKKVLVYFLTSGLVQMQIGQFAYALDPNDVRTGVNIVGHIGSQILQNKADMIKKQIAENERLEIQRLMQPRMQGNRYFSECQLPSSQQNLPQNVCAPTNDPYKIATMYNYETEAKKVVNFYDQMMNEATSLTNVGVACINHQKKNFDSQMTEMINNLTRLQDELKAQSQLFKEQNKQILSDLEEKNAELFGITDKGSSKGTINTKSRDFSKIVSPACQKIIGQNFGQTAEQFGFNGLLKSMGTKNRSAYDFTMSKSQIEDEIKKHAQTLKDSIAEVGIDNWIAGQSSRGQSTIQDKVSSFKSFRDLLETEKRSLLGQKQRILSEINNLSPGLSVPTGNSPADLQKFINGAGDYLKKKYVDECTRSSSKGVSIDLEKLLSTVEQRGTDNSPAAIKGYKEALANIINSDDFISDKLDQIKALESTYNGMTITYSDSNGAATFETPYKYFEKVETICKTRYSESQTFNKNQANGLSEAEKAKKVQSLLQEFKNLNDNFSGKLGNSIVNTLINCNGESLKSTDNCSEDNLDTTKGGFCVAKASTCANSMLNCYQEIDKQVNTRKTQISNLSKVFNANVNAMAIKANALYKNQLAKITTLTKLIQQKFPGANFEIPTDMFIPTPLESKKDKYGIEMAMDGDIEKISAILPDKIKKLQEMFANQKEAADNEIDEYLSKIQTAMKTEQNKFRTLASECGQIADSSANNLAQMDQEKAKGQAEMDSKVKKFCVKYSGLSTHPNGACKNIDKLADEAAEISSRLDNSAINTTNGFKNVCNEYNNESSESDRCSAYDNDPMKKDECEEKERKKGNKSGSSSKAIKMRYTDICRDGDKTTDESALKKLVSKMSAKENELLPRDERKIDYDKISSYLKGDDEDSLDSSPLFRGLKEELSGSDSICTQLSKRGKAGAASKETTDAEAKVTDAQKAVDAAATDAKPAAQTALDSAKKALSDAKAKDASNKSYKEVDELLTELASSFDQQQPSDKALKLTKLGEQVTEACDAQASTGIGKNPFAFDLNNYDNSRLGNMGASR